MKRSSSKKKTEPIDDPKREFQKLIRTICNSGHQLWRVFADFCEMGALSLSNVLINDEAREARYMKLIGGYKPDEQAIFPQLLGCVTMGLEDVDRDFLGECFQELELSNHWKGQFFTPMSVCQVMAHTIIDDETKRTVAHRGFITVNEPACGAGATLIAVVRIMLDKGLNPQQHLHITAQDIDATAAHMCFIQLSLMGIPAHVIIGNTLAVEEREVWTTMHHHTGFWTGKLRRGYALGTPASWENQQAHESLDEPMTKLAQLLRVRFQSPVVPPALVKRLVEAAGVREGEVVLVPWAGDGALARAILEKQPKATVMCLEENSAVAAKLNASGLTVVGTSIFAIDPEVLPPITVIVMHSPHTVRSDIHQFQAFMRADELLKQGDFAEPSTLVSTMPAETLQHSTTQEAKDFRGHLHAAGCYVHTYDDNLVIVTSQKG